MSKHFSIENAVAGIKSVLGAKDELAAVGVDIPEALKMNHVVMQWVIGQPDVANQIIAKIHTADEENIHIIDELWKTCARDGIDLTTEQKIALFQDFLDD
jgi:hypothetical protein